MYSGVGSTAIYQSTLNGPGSLSGLSEVSLGLVFRIGTG